MKKFNRKKTRRFSLMELVIVIGIMAGLAAIAVPAYQGIQAKAKVNQARTEIKALETACEAYNLTNNEYPSSLADLISSSNGGPFLKRKSVPKDPWNHEYVYSKTDNGYSIICYGSDGTQGGTGNAQDISSDGE